MVKRRRSAKQRANDKRLGRMAKARARPKNEKPQLANAAQLGAET